MVQALEGFEAGRPTIAVAVHFGHGTISQAARASYHKWPSHADCSHVCKTEDKYVC